MRTAGVGPTDFTMLAGNYSFAPKIPFVPGYEIAGTVDAELRLNVRTGLFLEVVRTRRQL